MPAVAVAPAHRRHDISDRVWEILEPLLPGGKGKTGRPAQDNRRFINAVFWIFWRDLPPDYGDWKNTHRRFCRWRDRNVWAGVEAVMDDPDYEWLMIDASYIKAHPHSAGAPATKPLPAQKGAQQQAAPGGGGMPVRLAVTAGTVADCSQALPLIEGIKAEHLLADKAYDTNEIVAGASARGMNPVIPPKSNRKEKRDTTGRSSCGIWWRTVSWSQAVAGSGDPVCQELPFLPGHLPDSWRFGLNYFDDTP